MTGLDLSNWLNWIATIFFLRFPDFLDDVETPQLFVNLMKRKSKWSDQVN